MVLDVQWLQTLSPILWDFAHARMSCWRDDHRVGDRSRAGIGRSDGDSAPGV
jgi:hypothetical protein